ncbi:cullin-9-like isoform X1 [Pleurodeles waltl]
MVGEKGNGNLLVHLGPRLQAYPEELVRQRRAHDGHTEYLIRWSIISLDDNAGANTTASSSESKTENILMWMSTEEVYANCPTLLGKRKHEGQRVKEEKAPSTFPSDATLDQVSLQEMKADVRSLVQRASKQMSRTSGPESSILNTIHVLSAYASIGSLTGVFKETGALDLLMKMLCNEEKQIRRSAGKMLRALASHDAGSRAYVLLSLSQQDGIEQHMDFDSRYTLLELFAETTSSEEHCISFDGIHLPQIPGKLLFSLVKRYLCVTSLVDKLNSSSEEAVQPHNGAATSSPAGEQSRVLMEFEFSMAMANLISELVRVMGWDRGQHIKFRSPWEVQPRILRSIFQPKVSSCNSVQLAPPPRKKSSNGFKTRSDFASRSGYVEYVQENLKPGMSVRMLEDYEQVSTGDEGEFRQSNDGTPPVQVYWQSLGRTYWVHWHMVEIISSSGQSEKETQEKASNLTENLKLTAVSQTFYYKPLGGLYTLPYLTDIQNETSGKLSQSEWWELLFFIKKLEPQEQLEVNQLIQQSQKVPVSFAGPGCDRLPLREKEGAQCTEGRGEAREEKLPQLSELPEAALAQLQVPIELAQKTLLFLNQHCKGCTLSDLTSSHVYIKYFLTKGGPEKSGQNGISIPTEYSGAALSKKSKKDALSVDATPAPGPPTEGTDVQLFNELLKAEGMQLPEMDEKSKVSGSLKGQAKKSFVERFGDAIDVIRKSSSELVLQLAGLGVLIQLLDEEVGRERPVIKSDTREKMVKTLVDLLTNQVKEKKVMVMALQSVYRLMLKFDWRVLFATEGGVRAVLASMHEHSSSASVQQAALAVLKVLTGAENLQLHSSSKACQLSHADAQVMREIFASIGSAASPDSDSLLCVIPAAIRKMLSTPGCLSAVENGLLVVNMLINSHRGLAEQLMNCSIHTVLQSCCDSMASPQYEMLSLIIKNRLAEHKLPVDVDSAESDLSDSSSPFFLKGKDLKKLSVSLKEISLPKEIILALERLICDDSASVEHEIPELLKDRNWFLMLLRNLEQLRMEKAIQLGILRILNRFLDNYQEDVLPWHESIEPCLSSMAAHNNDREVVQEFIRFLHRLATTNKDCAVVMCRLGTREALTKALDKHSSNLLLVTELKDVVTDCEKYASLYKKMTTSILAGCIQMVLGQIEEHRRNHLPINIPFFDVFLRNLCQGSSVEVKEDKCWEKVEVSSNPHRANKLTDRNPKSYWESNGSTSSHYINIYMHRGVVIRQLILLVASEDSSYMPARVVVVGGETPSSINTELNTVNIPATASRVVLLENLTRFWPIIQIKIKRCQQGGIDTRVHGFEILGPKPTFWPVFKEQLCRRTYLFYTTKAHTWCQEISEDRMQLLQLFSKLNSALRHEQMFADRFLPDDEAAQALGRTCWEALINPLVQNITTPDASGISPLSWLLNDYLENSEKCRQAKCRATKFNSRVRRLSHLLVHVDISNLEESRPPTKAEGKNSKAAETSTGAVNVQTNRSSSISGVTQCWQGVVQEQVKKFLESAWDAPDFVERYRNVYLRLKNAMEELFGQQAAFMLALRNGFSGALLQLSFSTAMNVSEKFARYIDEQIQKSRRDLSNVKRLRQLQQFLEPMLFLSGLELANTFEHFYRHYLGDRLLSQGKVWLESAVIEQMSLCFPNRFPQQMLKNLMESEELQQEFHLFLLQQLDKKLLDDGDQEDLKEAIEDHPRRAGDDPEVKVLVLSPRCWTVSPLCHMDDPTKYLPASLSSYLTKFSDFYVKGQTMYGAEHLNPRRLQWTWLGHAELEFGAHVLHVSTLQMYILLHFNHQKTLSVESLLQSTGLPPSLLVQALAPLTGEHGILTMSKSKNKTKDLLPKGVLRLNDASLTKLAKPQSPMWLLPNQTYLNVEDAEGTALEKKRNIICCLVVKLLKEEKAMHIDNLVFKVIDSCQKCDQRGSLKFLNFCCSHTDVLSCVIHLINEGYVRRNEDRLHVLEYVSEDPQPQPPPPPKETPAIVFHTAEIRKVSNNSVSNLPNDDKRLTFSTFR